MAIDWILSELLASPARAGLAGAVAGLAYTARRRYETSGGAPAAPGRAAGLDAVREPSVLEAAGFLPPPRQESGGEPLARLLLRAMIAAARADGKLDGDERRRFFDRIGGLDLGDAERAELYAELEKPVTPEQLADAVAGPAQAGLADELVASLHREAGLPTGPR